MYTVGMRFQRRVFVGVVAAIVVFVAGCSSTSQGAKPVGTVPHAAAPKMTARHTAGACQRLPGVQPDREVSYTHQFGALRCAGDSRLQGPCVGQ